jgi:SAM-dependent methyltransferase
MEVFSEDGTHVLEGVLRCGNGCWYPIVGGVPRMLLDELRDGFSDFARRHGMEGPAPAAGSSEPAAAGRGLGHVRLQRATAASFGHEWSEYARFGWSAADLEGEVVEMDVADYGAVRREVELAHTIPTFRRKTLLQENDVAGRLVLDVGCGNGRYCFVARHFGAEVVGLDLSAAADAAFVNTRHLEGVHVVQGDGFRAPFADRTFGAIFSIGVLHHTPSAKHAMQALPRLLRSDGVLSVHLYRRRNSVFEVIDRGLRAITTRLPLSWCWHASHLPTFAGKLLFRSRLLFAGANSLLTVHATHHHNFDWYSAPVATHHTEDEVAGWFRDAGMRELVSDDPMRWGDSYFARIYPAWARNEDGTVKGWAHALCPHWALTVRGRRPSAGG